MDNWKLRTFHEFGNFNKPTNITWEQLYEILRTGGKLVRVLYNDKMFGYIAIYPNDMELDILNRLYTYYRSLTSAITTPIQFLMFIFNYINKEPEVILYPGENVKSPRKDIQQYLRNYPYEVPIDVRDLVNINIIDQVSRVENYLTEKFGKPIRGMIYNQQTREFFDATGLNMKYHEAIAKNMAYDEYENFLQTPQYNLI